MSRGYSENFSRRQSEAHTGGVLWNKLFLKVSQISLEDSYVEVNF